MKLIAPGRAFATLVAAAALGIAPLGAQTAGGLGAKNSPPSRRGTPASARPVSADILRHPLKEKVRRMLQRAVDAMNAGNHQAAIGQLKQTLNKYPDSAPYAESFLGVEYVKTLQFQDAVHSLEQAVLLLPHDAMTHYNFGLSLAGVGDYTRAEQETRRALELNPNIEDAQTLIGVLERRKAISN